MNHALDRLVASKTIHSYKMDNLNENGVIGRSESNNSERLTIVFNDRKSLVINVVCSGCLENTSFQIYAEEHE